MVAPFSGALVRSNLCMLGMTRDLRMALIVSVLVEFVALSGVVVFFGLPFAVSIVVCLVFKLNMAELR